MKSSPPVPDIRLSVRRIERLSVVTEPTGIMGIVATVFPPDVIIRNSPARKLSPINMTPSHATFLPWRGLWVQKIATLRERVIGRERTHMSVVWNIARMGQ
jgi:hypothetical protein